MSKEITFREAIRDGIAEAMRADERVFLMGEEVGQFQGAYKASQGLLEEFGPKRIIDTPITEHGFAGLGVGAAFAGLRPIIEFMTFNFGLQAMDQIINSAAKTKYMSGGAISSPIVFRGPNGAGTRVGAQHSQCFASWFSNIPGLVVISPYFPSEAKALLTESVRYDGPVVFLENELLYSHKFSVDEQAYSSEQNLTPKPDVPASVQGLSLALIEEQRGRYDSLIGKARIVLEGDSVTIVSFSIYMELALKAAAELKQLGINAEVIDLRTLRPLDFATVINSVKKTGRLVTVEGGWGIASVCSTLASVVSREAFDYLDAPMLNVCGTDVPMPYAANLEKLALPQVKDVIDACRQVCYAIG